MWNNYEDKQRELSTEPFLSLSSRTSDPTLLDAIAPLLKAHFSGNITVTSQSMVTLTSTVAQRLLGSACSPGAKLAIVSLSDTLVSSYNHISIITKGPRLAVYRQALLRMIGSLAELYSQTVRDNPKQRHPYLRACVRCLQALEYIGERGLCKVDPEIEVFLGDPIINPYSEGAAVTSRDVGTEATFCLYFLLNVSVFPDVLSREEEFFHTLSSMALDELLTQYSEGNLSSICAVNIISLVGFIDSQPAFSGFWQGEHHKVGFAISRALGDRMHWGVIVSNDIVDRLNATPLRREYVRLGATVWSALQGLCQDDESIKRLQDPHSLSPWYKVALRWILEVRSQSPSELGLWCSGYLLPTVQNLSRVASISLDRHGTRFISEDVHAFIYLARSTLQSFDSELSLTNKRDHMYVYREDLGDDVRTIIIQNTELLEKMEGMC